MVGENDLAARLHHAGHLVEGALRLGHHGQNIGADDGVKAGVGELEVHGVHDQQCLDIAKLVGVDPLAGDVQHGLAKVDPRNFYIWPEHGQFKPSAHAHVEHAPAGLVEQGGCRHTAGTHHPGENSIIEGGPAGIGVIDVFMAQNRGGHFQSLAAT